MALAVSTGGIFYNPATPALTSYGQCGTRASKKICLVSTKNTPSVFVVIACAALVTGKPLKEAQYLADQAWPKLAELQPNVLNLYTSDTAVAEVAQGEGDIGGIEYSKYVYPYTVKGAQHRHGFPKEGAFAGVNCQVLVKGAPNPDLGVAFMNCMLSTRAVQMPLAEVSLAAPPIAGMTFEPELAKLLAYPEAKMDEMALFSPDWAYINARPCRRGSRSTTRSSSPDMGDIEVRGVSKRYGAGPAGGGRRVVRRPARPSPVAAGSERLRQDHDDADDRRAGGARAGDDRRSRASRSSACPCIAATSACCSRTTRCSHISTWRCNVAFGLEMRRLPKREVVRRAMPGAGDGEAGHFADRMPHQLSGGQQQRVALARALVIEPAVLLLDEPLGALDKKLRETMQIELRQLQQRLNITTLMVTHDQEEALTIVRPDRGDARWPDRAESARRTRSMSARCRSSSRASSACPISLPGRSRCATTLALPRRPGMACNSDRRGAAGTAGCSGGGTA